MPVGPVGPVGSEAEFNGEMFLERANERFSKMLESGTDRKKLGDTRHFH